MYILLPATRHSTSRGEAAALRPPQPDTAPKLLDVANLRINFGTMSVVDGVSLSLSAGEVLGLVGESGSGKSMTALALMRLLPPGGTLAADRLTLLGEDLLAAPARRLEALRGHQIGMIFQEPMTALNPVLSIGSQIGETARRHLKINRQEARDRGIEALKRVGIPAPESRIDDFPHQLSGGMRQRVMIAMALVCEPRLLIADEPTTALDVTIQAQILELLQDLQAEYHMGIILISHDLGVISSFADRVAIMYCGQVVEEALADRIFHQPMHPYTEGLLASIPATDHDVERLTAIEGTVPPPWALPPGCRFAPRCGYAREICTTAQPPMTQLRPGSRAACWRNTGYAPPGYAPP
ncbi:MAG TPA: ABC transporter ATP-binding protein [Acetobacteraceae bacterium]|nr:ABC transporter ATP-binding protein [Acetobacteraceae bacterium]